MFVVLNLGLWLFCVFSVYLVVCCVVFACFIAGVYYVWYFGFGCTVVRIACVVTDRFVGCECVGGFACVGVGLRACFTCLCFVCWV